MCSFEPLLLSGYLIAYLAHGKKDVAPTCEASVDPVAEPLERETGAAPLMNWEDVKKLLTEKLSAAKMEPVFRYISRPHSLPVECALRQKVICFFVLFFPHVVIRPLLGSFLLSTTKLVLKGTSRWQTRYSESSKVTA